MAQCSDSAVCALAVGCSGTNGPVGPTANWRAISRTRFLAFGDSFTAGEVTSPVSASPTLIHTQVVVPAASYPSVLQSQLQSTYRSQSSSITVINSGQASERILEGVQRFPAAFASSQADACC